MDVETFNTILYCENFGETVRFYGEIIGFKVVLSKSWFVEFAVNPMARVSVADRNRASIPSSHGHGITLTFRTSDLKIIHDRLRENGFQPTEIVTHGWGARLFHVKDPEGHRLEFWASQD